MTTTHDGDDRRVSIDDDGNWIHEGDPRPLRGVQCSFEVPSIFLHPADDDAPTLDPLDLAILELLDAAPARMKRYEIAQHKSIEGNRNAVGVSVRRLLDLHFVAQPEGERKGVEITPAGHAHLDTVH